VAPDGSASTIPVTDRQQSNNGVIICTKTQRALNKNLSEVAILGPTAGIVFPGALVLADQNLSERASDPDCRATGAGDPDRRPAGIGKSQRDSRSRRVDRAAFSERQAQQ
jgi:hypothetical protein